MAISASEHAFFVRLGARMAELRKSQDITQVEMAKTLGVSQQTINSYEVGRRRVPVSAPRNAERFPPDFMFRMSHAEAEALNRSQSVTGSQKHRDPRFPPYAFTEHGAMMAAMILNSPRAVEMSVYVVRAFVKLRELLASNRELARRYSGPLLKPAYTEADVIRALHFAGAVGLLAAVELAQLSKNDTLAKATLQRAREFAARIKRPARRQPAE
jgi:transcriptional regulator with XRE-family HTH domain